MAYFPQTYQSWNALYPAFFILSEIDGDLRAGDDIIIVVGIDIRTKFLLLEA